MKDESWKLRINLKPAAEITEDFDIPLLKEKLEIIKTYCIEYNKKPAKEELNGLRKKQWSSDVTNLLSSVSEYLLHSDFDKAAEDINSFLTNL